MKAEENWTHSNLFRSRLWVEDLEMAELKGAVEAKKRSSKMSSSKLYGKPIKVVFVLLLWLVLLAVMAMKTMASGLDISAQVVILDQPVNVDGDEAVEHFSAVFRVLKNGAVVGEAKIRDVDGTNVYQFSSGKIVCDVAGQPYLLLDGVVVRMEDQHLLGGSPSFSTVLSSNGHSGALIWGNHWKSAANGFELRGQMIFFGDVCSESWADWTTVM
jgi:hypothetical protein